ncbi:MAG: carbohydrate ABC transporter substrate-binding protein [Anaerolineales bacterium]|nr:carbohydrate ABC transporter substrate-binding protein [Anaerolineales bacterium]
MAKDMLSRRCFLQLAGTTTVGALLAACGPAATQAPAEPTSEEPAAPTAAAPAEEVVEIEYDAGGFTPSKYIGADLEEGQAERVAFDTVANAYMDDHPNVKIKFVPAPMGDRREAAIMMLTGGTAPDCMWTQPDQVNEDLGKGWWLALDPFMELPNPYCPDGHPGRSSWHESFYPAVDFWRAPDGNLYMLLGDQTQVGIYYNKTLFQEVGIGEAANAFPDNWEEMMSYGAALLDAGYPGYAWCGGGAGVLDQLTWTSGWLSKYFFWDYIKGWDTNNDGMPSKWEMSEAIQDGTFSAAMEENVERLRALKRMAVYWQEGALGMDWEATHRLFLTGSAGMEITGVWMLQTFLDDPDRDFDLGWFYFPAVDKSTSTAVNPDAPLTNLAAGYGSFQVAITNTATRKGTESQCADFLMWSTTPENIGLIVNEIPSTIPNVVDADLHPLTVEFGFADSVSYLPSSFQEDDSLLDYEYGVNFASVVGPYCVGQMDEATMLERLQEYMDAAAERVLAARDESE